MKLMKLISNVRAFFLWLVVLSIAAIPLVPFLLVLNRDFNGGFVLPEKAIIAVAGFIAIIISTGKEYLAPNSLSEVRGAIGWLVISLLLLFFYGLLKVLLFEVWKGGDYSTDFSPQDFDVAVSSYMSAAYKPFSWFRWVMFGSAILAFATFTAGTLTFLRLLFPNISRHGRFFRLSRISTQLVQKRTRSGPD